MIKEGGRMEFKTNAIA